ncbi:hypothetical protein [Pontibacter anaerobius]|uniref:Uncharacterized protein n=1 Tax=Pontibacter anaerobius TaxID=2993940 RepID=A0ABT3RBS1_9BACT|nr:hypothetical protein [Pontibacter anaerobius]MCX2738975.1 hypothetical protein [Pontibacter anaerobius]
MQYWRRCQRRQAPGWPTIKRKTNPIIGLSIAGQPSVKEPPAEVMLLTLSFPSYNFAPQSLAWTPPSESQLSPGFAEARLPVRNAISSFGSFSDRCPALVAFDAAQP